MSIKRMTAVWEHSAQNGNTLLLLLAIADNANDLGYAWPGIEYLAKKIRSSAATVMRHTKALEDAGELVVQHNRNTGNRYVVTVGLTKAELKEALNKHLKMDEETISVKLQHSNLQHNNCQVDTSDIAPVTVESSRTIKEPSKTKEEDSNTTPSAKSADGEMGASENGNVNPSKKESPHTIMKNAILGAFGWDAAHVADWGVIDAASKKLRKVEFPPGELPALYAYCASKFDKFGPGCLASHVAAYYKEKNNHATTQSRVEQKYEVPASRQRTGQRPLKRESRVMPGM